MIVIIVFYANKILLYSWINVTDTLRRISVVANWRKKMKLSPTCSAYLLIQLAVAFVAAFPAQGQTISSVPLKTSGLNIVDGNGNNVRLRGVNLGGWMVMEPWMCPADASGLQDEYSIIQKLDTRFGVATEQSLIRTYRQSWITTHDLDNIEAQGLNVIRVPVWWGDFYPLSALGTTNPTMRSDAFTVLDTIISAAAARGIYTIIDMHGVFGGQSTSNDTGQQNKNLYWTNTTDQNNTALMWSAIAAHYKGNAAVAGYDLINEPSGAPNTTAVWVAFNNLYTTVRAADPNHIVIMEGTFGNWNWNMLPSPTTYSWTNVVYQMHEYQWSNTTVIGVETGANNQVTDFNNHKSWNVPAYIGEFNAFGTGTAAWQYVVNDFNNDNMNWSPWSYKATHGSQPDSWGLYDPTGTWPTTPNIANDSPSTIASEWALWTTANAFAINPMISSVIAIAPQITSSGTVLGVQNTPFSFQVTATGLPTHFTATGLPAGLSINSTSGLISGTPTAVGTSTVNLSATNSGGTGTATLTLTVTATASAVNTIDLNFSGSADPITGVGAYTGDGLPSPKWNNVRGTTSTLVTSDGVAAPGVGVSFTDSGTYSAPTTPSLLGQFLLALSSSTQTVTLTGLTPNANYQLYLYGQNGSFKNRGATFSISTGTGSPAAGSNASTANASTTSFVKNENYVIFNVKASSSGTLGISWTQPSSGGGEGDFNGLQLVPTSQNTIDLNFSGGADPITGLGAYTGDGLTNPHWNNVTANTSTLVTSDGAAATGVAVSFTDSGTYSAPTTPALLGQFLLALRSSTQTVTLTGLKPSGNYQLYLYGENGSYKGRGATFSITTGSGSPAFGSNASTANVANNSFEENVNFVVFDVTATSSGTLAIGWTQPPAGGGEGDFNGLQLVPTFP